MTPQEYLKQTLTDCSKYELTDLDMKSISISGVEEFIYSKLTSKKYRKWKIDAASTEQVKEAIHLNVSSNKPIKFRYPFGGYKLWRLESYPQVDWAEFYTIAYYASYLAPITKAYSPGVELIFSSDDTIIERMDNVPTKDTQAYFDSFQKLLVYFKRYLPKNLLIEIKRIGDLYPDKDVFEKELAESVQKQLDNYDKMDPVRRAKMLKTSALNIKWQGAHDWTSLSPIEKEEKLKYGIIYHDGYGKVPRRVEYNRAKDKIVLFTTPISNAIAIGNTKNSITKFWTGIGVLEKTSQYQGRILSPHQIEEAKAMEHTIEQIDLIDLHNFNNIVVYDTQFSFI